MRESTPYGQQSEGPPPFDARGALNVPSILLMVFGGIGVLFALYGAVAPTDSEQMATLLRDPNLPPAFGKAMTSLAGAGGKLVNLFGALLGGAMVYGALQMRSLRMYPAAVASAVLGMFPCTSCCCVTLPIGIWALVVLLKPEVKSQFT